MSGQTSRRDESDWPQSPRTKSFSQVQYCTGRDRSSPRVCLYSSSACGFTRGFRASAATGSVEDRTAMNTRMLAMNKIGIAHSTRLTTNLVILYLPKAKDRGGDAGMPDAAPSLYPSTRASN